MNHDLCPLCSGTKRKGTITFTVDYSDGVLVVRNVPATVCSQCCEEWIADTDASRLEQYARIARNEKKQFEVVDFTLASAA
ncbi:MAG: type II toxin-antitoxin system MqsA family antitoxin [Bacteroidetes bacterium]|nr:type II toxin-antitoxin system MqsA family antitoxin [Bacteroidota bacterium]MCW5895450.1 type II toxin-antitoxin system MqsA family antitoxin [Bacteroidota bacterium]